MTYLTFYGIIWHTADCFYLQFFVIRISLRERSMMNDIDNQANIMIITKNNEG
jgi:hypothetical protein